MNGAAAFERYVGIDYSGAQTPVSRLKGLRVFMVASGAVPSEVHPPPSQRKYWTRRGVAEWLADQLLAPQPTLVGIDHGFSFPLQYFQQHGVPLDWTAFLEDFHRHWPTEVDSVYVDFVRDGTFGNGAERSGDTRWRRLTEVRARAAKSVFHFDVQGSVAKSTHSGLPWLLYLRRSLAGRIHFWPFDGWVIPPGRSAVVEVYPALWSRGFPTEGRDKDQHDAYSVALWMQRTDQKGGLREYLQPQLTAQDRVTSEIEGWILGVA